MTSTSIAINLLIVVASARAIDFLIGKKGRAWVKNKIIFRTWYNLQNISLKKLLVDSAKKFNISLEFLFGKAFLTPQALIISFLIGCGLIFLFSEFLSQFSKPVAHKESDFMLFTPLFLINPIFDFFSFATTRYFAKQITKNPSILNTVKYWIRDIFACIIISGLTFFVVHLFHKFFGPEHALAVWFGSFEVYTLSVLTMLSGFFPTILHTIFVLFVLLLALLEILRLILCYLLERFDESDKSPITIIAGSVATIATIIITINTTI